jgi:acyl-CoA thioester hydrolase
MSAHRTDIQVRFGDTDALGHLNNTAYAAYAEHARLSLFRSLEATAQGFILAHLSIDFLKQVSFDDNVHVLTTVEKLGNTSIHLRQEIFASGDLAAKARSVVVVFDYASQKPARIPDPLRQALSRYALTDEGD